MHQNPSSFKVSLSFHNKTLHYFYSQIEQQQRLLDGIKKSLPSNLANQTRHCLIKDKKLIIYTDSAVWASQLRFYKEKILKSIKELTKSPIESLQIKVISYHTGLTLTYPRKAKLPSIKNIEIIQSHGQTVSDNQLKQALLNLSSTLTKLSNKS
ncbi:MAG: DUF721 domain-containing protein [Methylococcales bacterium]|jgi:hypothetical protein